MPLKVVTSSIRNRFNAFNRKKREFVCWSGSLGESIVLIYPSFSLQLASAGGGGYRNGQWTQIELISPMSNAFTSRFNLYPHALAVQAGDGDLFHRHDHRRKDNEGVERRDEQFDFKFPIM